MLSCACLWLLWLVGTTANSNVVETRDTTKWGRVYLRHGIEPIQYFKATYGPSPLTEEREIQVLDAIHYGCAPFTAEESAQIQGKFLLLDRGECTLEMKSRHAQDAGAQALIVASGTEESVAPTGGFTDDYEFTITTVMIRHSGGEQLKAASRTEPIHGRLVPIHCAKHPETGVLGCSAFTTEENEYPYQQVTGGYIHTEENEKVGEFLHATYGPPMRQTSVPVLSLFDADGCEAWSEDIAGTAVVLERGKGISLIPACWRDAIVDFDLTLLAVGGPDRGVVIQ